MIVVTELTKQFGSKLAVDRLSFDVKPGEVTGFLGPNGSGKSTSMRCMLGLDRPDSGATTFGGRPYVGLNDPIREVGSLLDAGYVHPGRSAANHLWWLAASNGIPKLRVAEVLALVGLTEVADKRVRTFSLGMRQRLGLAGVLLGDPHTVILDEPANGLDPEGIRWIRDVLRHLAGQGRTVLVSSHLLSEMALIATSLVVIGQGRLIEQGPVQAFVDRYADRWVRVMSPQIGELRQRCERLNSPANEVTILEASDGSGALEVRGASATQIGELAAAAGLVLHELAPQTGSLEDAYLQATMSAVEYHGGQFDAAPGGAATTATATVEGAK
jgi:ABC-2 type transport system ATP-binding protein